MLVTSSQDPVSRRRYERERTARKEAERLLDVKSRALWEANQKLKSQADELEKQVETRTNELNKAMRAAEANSQAKSIFLASMSHEIRTPLNGVLGMAEALTDTSLSSEQKQMARTIVDSGNILLSVLNDILDISKIEAGQLEVEAIPFDLDAMLKATEQLFGFKANEKNLGFSVVLEEDSKPWIVSDPVRIRQVLGNLISNAVKFTAEGEVRVRVSLLREADHTTLLMAVSDSGEGIPETRLNDLFTPFQQLDASVNRRHGGTGLGLAISRQICRIMGGDVSAQSVEGLGSTFRASFQVGLTQPPESAHAEKNILRAKHVLSQGPWRVLVAEDNKTNQLVFLKLMKAFNLDVTMVEDGFQAVSAFKEAVFDLVLMDINMPQMGGTDATILIREYEQANDIEPTPIIALTANSMTHQVSSYLACGMNEHIAKPFKRDDLVLRLAAVLEGQS